MSIAIAVFIIGLLSWASGRRPDRETDSGKKDLTRNYYALVNWCEQSLTEIDKENHANPIRGKEFTTSKLEYLRRELEGKTVHWRITVNEIDPAANVRVASFRRVERVVGVDHLGPLTADVPILLIRNPHLLRGENEKRSEHLGYLIKNVPMPKLRELSVGEFATISGTVSKVNLDGGFLIDLEGAKVE